MRRWVWLGVVGVGLIGGAVHAGEPRARVRYTGQVNLNEATAAQLDLLPSVGQKAAERIVAWRQKRPFKRVDELVRVKGFGRKRMLRLKPYLTLQGETTLQAERVPVSAADQG